MISEPFAIGNSYIHSLDPRAKIVFATAYSIIVALSDRFSVLFIALFISIILVLLCRLNSWEVGKRLSVVLWFLLLIWITLPFTFEGELLYKKGMFTITRPGVILAAMITIKSLTILLTFMALIATMTIDTMGHALNCLHIPGKFIHLMLITYRYIFVIEKEYHRLWTAAKIRGFCPGTNIHSYKTYAYLVGMLFVRASNRAQQVNRAMMCRGFQGKFFTLYDYSFSIKTWIFSIFMTIIIASLLVIELI